MPKPNLDSVLKTIDRENVLLVFSIKTKPQVPSLWSCFHPKSKMRWEWDETGDNRVADLWHLRERAFSSGEVAYAKWYQRRATFFSKKIFTQLLAVLNYFPQYEKGLSRQASYLLQALEENSPLSTKQLKAVVNLKGPSLESEYTRALSELWARLLIVGCGEVEDGAFPSLAIGATKRIFEEEWKQAQKRDPHQALAQIQEELGDASPFYRYLLTTRRKIFSRPIKSMPKKKWLSLDDLRVHR